MCITAHPDDESAAFGGTLLMSNARGIETSVVCLTDGQAATFRGAASDGAELASLRRSEFAAACQKLCVSRCEVLDYQDGELPKVNFYEAAGVLVERIRRFRPQVVLTFGAEGGVNQHKDHTMACLLTTAAFHWSGRDAFFPEQLAQGLRVYSPQKLYVTHPPFLISRDGKEQKGIAMTPCSLSLELGEYKEKKVEAFSLHTTQLGVLEKIRDVFEKHGDQECYWLSASSSLSTQDDGMFDGVTEDGAENGV